MIFSESELYFEQLKFNPLSNNVLLDNLSDLDPNENTNTRYLLPEETPNYLSNAKVDDFSILHVNIRSIQKNFEKLKFLLSKLNYTFKIICLSETGCNDKKSIPHLQNYHFLHQGRQNKKGGGVLIFVHNSLNFKIKNELNISTEDVEIINKVTKNIIINLLYRPPAGKIKSFKNLIKDLLRTNEKTKKKYVFS